MPKRLGKSTPRLTFVYWCFFSQGHSPSTTFASVVYTLPGGYQILLSFTVDRSDETLSISLHLMPGDYDAILPWPFSCQMAFSLCDLIRKQNDFLTSSRSDRHSSSFQRPRSAMNVGCCIRNFIPLAELTRQNSPYIDGDSIFIKILFIKDPVAIELLPNLMSINPGLPGIPKDLDGKGKRKQAMKNVTHECCSLWEHNWTANSAPSPG